MKSKKVYVSGMHCLSCEKLLESELKNIAGIKKVVADRKGNFVEIFFVKSFDFKQVEAMVEKFGYKAFLEKPGSDKDDSSKKNNNSLVDWIKAIVIIGFLLLGYRIFQGSGILADAGMDMKSLNYGVAFLIGLVASLSSCLVIVGGAVIAFGEKFKSEGKSFFERSVKPNLLFQFGRLSTFFVLGGVLGMIGAEISLSAKFVALFTVGIAIVLFWLGLDILGFLPSISRVGIRMPKKLTSKWDDLKESNHKLAPVALGGLSFFLPCGFTQSMQLFALASGNFWVGALSLFFFALGTFPSLFLLGTFASWTKNNKIAVFQKVAGILVVIFAVYTFQSGKVLLGADTKVITSNENATKAEKQIKESEKSAVIGNEQVVEVKLNNFGFTPSTIEVESGMPVKFVIKATQVSGCTNRVIIPEFDISKNIVRGENVIRFTPKEKGVINYSCWMGMVRGKIVVK